MRFKKANDAFREQWNVIPEDITETDKGLLDQMLSNVIESFKAQGITDYDKYYFAFIECVESVFPDEPWYENLGLDIRQDLFNTQNPEITKQHILDSIIEPMAYVERGSTGNNVAESFDHPGEINYKNYIIKFSGKDGRANILDKNFKVVRTDADVGSEEEGREWIDAVTNESLKRAISRNSVREAKGNRVDELISIVDKSFDVLEEDVVLDESKQVRLLSIPGITRDESKDFTDDGTRFQCYLYKGVVPISYARVDGWIYLTIAFHHLDDIYSSEYQEFDSFKVGDDFNGVLPDQFDPNQFVKNLEAAYKDIIAFRGSVEDVDENDIEDRIKIINAACKQYKDKVSNYIKSRADKILQLQEYQFRRLKQYVSDAGSRTADYIRDASSASKREFMRADIKDLINRISSSWNFKYIEQLLGKDDDLTEDAKNFEEKDLNRYEFLVKRYGREEDRETITAISLENAEDQLDSDGYVEYWNYLPDFNYDLGESVITEDTVRKSNGKWTNRGKDGKEHGEFNTKKEADAQRRAMYANGYKESLTYKKLKSADNKISQIKDKLNARKDVKESWQKEADIPGIGWSAPVFYDYTDDIVSAKTYLKEHPEDKLAVKNLKIIAGNLKEEYKKLEEFNYYWTQRNSAMRKFLENQTRLIPEEYR